MYRTDDRKGTFSFPVQFTFSFFCTSDFDISLIFDIIKKGSLAHKKAVQNANEEIYMDEDVKEVATSYVTFIVSFVGYMRKELAFGFEC